MNEQPVGIISGLSRDDIAAIARDILNEIESSHPIEEEEGGADQLSAATGLLTIPSMLEHSSCWGRYGFETEVTREPAGSADLMRRLPDGTLSPAIARDDVKAIFEIYKSAMFKLLAPLLKKETVALGRRVFPEYEQMWSYTDFS